MLTIYTLKTCDTCKKALKWLNENEVAHKNHDVRVDGLTREIVVDLVNVLGVEAAVNKRSTTWRDLSDQQKDGLAKESAISLIEANPTLLKRPVFVFDDQIIAGFHDAVKQKILAQS